MSTEPRRTRQGAAQPPQQAAPGKAAKRSAPTTEPATKVAFDALVAAICGWFKAQKKQVPIKGFAALAARSQRATTTECTGAEKRALGALIGLAKDDEATWSLLRAFSVNGDKEQFTASYVLITTHVFPHHDA